MNLNETEMGKLMKPNEVLLKVAKQHMKRIRSLFGNQTPEITLTALNAYQSIEIKELLMRQNEILERIANGLTGDGQVEDVKETEETEPSYKDFIK